MNKKIAGILISVIFWTTYVSAAAYGIFKYSDTTRYVTVEKTGASHQEIIAGVSGKSILIRNIELFVDAACSMYMYQATSASPWATATNKIV